MTQGEMGTGGDCWHRYIVRVREIEQSCRIIRQALEKSGKDILYLSSLAPPQILELAGYSWHPDGR